MQTPDKITTYYHVLDATPEMNALKLLLRYHIIKKQLKRDGIKWEHPARQLVERAYFILSDPDRRAHYDAYLSRQGQSTYPNFIDGDTSLSLIFISAED